MGNIVLLDDLTINKIAAGEVIERPANVVKELVENSIDAGSNKIIIEIKNGGKTFIKISDNGTGIARDDIAISLERHATSKIRRVEDLENTYTMGFRGEALASISSISKLTIITKTKDDESGIKVFSESGNIVGAEDIGISVGTTILVENLFFNTPVRYKFLKQDSTEFRYIKEWVQKVALANPSISFKLINDGKNVFYTSGNGSLRDIVYLLYGKDVMNHIVDVNYKEGELKVSGVVGNTLMAEKTRKNQMIFLNKRNIKNQILINAADQAFKSGGTGIGKFGFFILFVEMPANSYDVNVHPTKTEVRFKDEDQAYKLIYQAVKSAILSKEFLGNTEHSNNEEYIANEFNFVTNYFNNSNNDKVNNFSSQSKFNTSSNFNKPASFNEKNENTDNSSQYFNRNKFENINSSKIDLKTDKNIKNSEETSFKQELEDRPNSELVVRDEKRKIDYKFLGISFKTYIIIEVGDEIYLIDQHAGHERLLYEQIRNNYKSNLQNNTQMMLFSDIVELTHKEIEFVKENINFFRNVGYDIELFGENTVKINGVPDIEYKEKVNNKNMFMDILDEMLNNSRSPIKDIEERFIATVACKAAVKAGMDLTKMEVDNLIQNLLILQNPYTCPHGRPTTIKLSKNEMFKF